MIYSSNLDIDNICRLEFLQGERESRLLYLKTCYQVNHPDLDHLGFKSTYNKDSHLSVLFLFLSPFLLVIQ